MQKQIIEATMRYQDLGLGFWGMIDEQGGHWLPHACPYALQQEGLRIKAEVQVLKGGMSAMMWGKAVKILNFEYL